MMRVLDVAADDPLLEEVYDGLLVPSFPADELETPEWLRAGPTEGTVVVSAVVDDDGTPVATAVGEWDPDSRVLLLSYLTVRPETRSKGLGGLLTETVGGAWQERFRPLPTLAEVEHPLAHEADRDRGDPAARLRFYARRGARPGRPLLPAGAAARCRTRARDVAARPRSGSRPPGEEAGTVDPGPVRAFLEEYLLSEGERETEPDGALRRTRESLERPGGIGLLPLDDVEALPLSAPDGF